jgi:hypothetical protein
MTHYARPLAILLLGGLLWVSLCPAEPFVNPKLRPPRAKPHRRAAAESLPPLPLPATPLRRSERKRQPAPPALVGLIQFEGETHRIVDGKRQKVRAFPTTQVDIEPLMNQANKHLGLRYRYMTTTFRKFSWDPTELPLLYITGWTPLPKIPGDLLAKLQRYLYDGGTLVLHAQCGRPEFHQSARELIARLFPKRKLDVIDPDSPLFHAYTPVKTVRFRKGTEPIQHNPPYLEAVYLGCRPAVILSPIDLNCSWDIVNHPIRGGLLYHRHDGLALGMNIVTTVLANFQYARAFGTGKRYPEQDDPSRDQLVLAQVVHEGHWDPTPHALPNLMKYVQEETTLNVQFKRELLRLTDPDVVEHPVLHMTGLRDFTLSDREVSRLRAYLRHGGLLIADAAAGRAAFDAAFRRELQRVLPDAGFKPLPTDHSLYQLPYTIGSVDYTPLVKAQQPRLNVPVLEGIEVNGQLAVIYSPFGLAAGWEQLGFAYNRGYSDLDALRIGVNLLAYALSH